MAKLENISQLDVEVCEEKVAIESNEVELDVIELTIEKSVSCPWTVPGGTVTFCNTIKNASEETTILDSTFIDELNPRFTYVTGSFTVDEVDVEPIIEGNTIKYNIEELAPEQELVICFKVTVDAKAEEGGGNDDEDDNL